MEQQAAPSDDSFVQRKDELNMGALPKKLVELEKKQALKTQSKKLKKGQRPPDATNV